MEKNRLNFQYGKKKLAQFSIWKKNWVNFQYGKKIIGMLSHASNFRAMEKSLER